MAGYSRDNERQNKVLGDLISGKITGSKGLHKK